MLKTNLLSLSVLLCLGIQLTAQTSNLPLIEIDALEYEGAFIIPGTTYGESHANYSNGTIEYNSTNHSLFFAGHNVLGGVAEFEIPPLVNSTTLSDLNICTNLQPYRTLLNDVPNPQAINTITGLKHYNGKLIINGLMYYNAAANNTHTSLVVNNASDIANSTLSGFYEMEGACHSAGWISDVPTNLQSLLGTNHLAGASSKHPINSRLAQGVTAFAVNPADFSGSTANMISTTPFMDYDLIDPVHADYSAYYNANYNIESADSPHFSGHTKADIGAVAGSNALWTELSAAAYGFIVPGTRTYFTIGSSGGHNSGIGYKAKQNNGNVCGGPCAYDANDYYNYYWLWDVNDMIAVKNGTMAANDVRPYAKGEFSVPFQTDVFTNTSEFHPIVGGTYNQEDGLLYLTIYDGAAKGKYSKNPVIVAYSIGDVFLNNEPSVSLGEDVSLCNNTASNSSLTVDVTGQVDSIESVHWFKNGIQIYINYPSNSITITSAGLYSVTVNTENGLSYSDSVMVDYVTCDCDIVPEIDYEIDNCLYSFSSPNSTTLTNGYTTLGYLWDFGNGVTSTLANPTHLFSTSDNAQVTFKHFVIDDDGNCCTREHSIQLSIDEECAFSCGIIPSIEQSSNVSAQTQTFQSNSTILKPMSAYRWTLDGNLVSTQNSVTLANANIEENQELCLTVYSIDADNVCCEETICQFISPTTNVNAPKLSQPNLDLTVSPNPNTGIAEINIKDFDEDKTYTMTLNTISGKTLKTVVLQNKTSTLDFTKYNVGLYFIHLSNGKQTKVSKIIKE